MKKITCLFLFFCFGISMVKAESNISLQSSSDEPMPQERSIIMLPTATLDGNEIRITFPWACTSSITIKDTSNGTVVISQNTSTPETNVIVDISSLETGKSYYLSIIIGDELYWGRFEL